MCIKSSPSTYRFEKVMSSFRVFRLAPATRTLPFPPEKKEGYGKRIPACAPLSHPHAFSLSVSHPHAAYPRKRRKNPGPRPPANATPPPAPSSQPLVLQPCPRRGCGVEDKGGEEDDASEETRGAVTRTSEETPGNLCRGGKMQTNFSLGLGAYHKRTCARTLVWTA